MLKDDDGRWVESPVHVAFGLTYASYYVVPRMVLEAMPLEWQQQFVKLMNELHEHIEYGEPNYTVLRKDEQNRKFIKDDLRHYRYPDYSLLTFLKPNPHG